MEKLSSLQFKGAIIGMVLGDGCISRGYIKTTSVIKEYAEMKKDILSQLTDTTISRYSKSKSSFGDKDIYEVRTRKHPIYTKLEMRMYHNRKRTIDEYCLKTITPLGLLIWYLDDGCLDKTCGLKFQIHSNAYDYPSHLLIQKYLNDRFGLRFNIRQTFKKQRNKRYFWLYLKAIDRIKFWDLVFAPYLKEIPEQIQYKIPARENIESMMESKKHKRFYDDIV
uniref:Putative homing endonuclease n=2 Tax=viral metagenome TaxID=1070528 RepID=A0A6M3XA15_9ZZZZ